MHEKRRALQNGFGDTRGNRRESTNGLLRSRNDHQFVKIRLKMPVEEKTFNNIVPAFMFILLHSNLNDNLFSPSSTTISEEICQAAVTMAERHSLRRKCKTTDLRTYCYNSKHNFSGTEIILKAIQSLSICYFSLELGDGPESPDNFYRDFCTIHVQRAMRSLPLELATTRLELQTLNAECSPTRQGILSCLQSTAFTSEYFYTTKNNNFQPSTRQ